MADDFFSQLDSGTLRALLARTAAQDAALQGLSALLKKEYVPRTDAVYDAVALQARNVIAFAGKPLACYGDIDRIRLMQALFRELGVQAALIGADAAAAEE